MSSSVTSLIGGIAGAIIGSAFGPLGTSIGFAIGSAAGGALGSKPPGPSLDIAKFNSSTYGVPLEIVYGIDRRKEKVIEAFDPKTSGGGGGKGGGSSSQTATMTWAGAMCEGPIASLLAVWFDGELVYDNRPNAAFRGDPPTAIYLGNASQGVDPTLEGLRGVGNVPAYRYTAYSVYEDRDITKYGRKPNVSYLICEATKPIPTRVATWAPPFDPSNTAANGNGPVGARLGDDGVLSIGNYIKSLHEYLLRTYDIDGNLLSTATSVTSVAPFGSGSPFGIFNCQNESTIGYGFLAGQGGGSPSASAWYKSGVIVAEPVAPAVGTDSFYSVIQGCPPFYYEDKTDPLKNCLYAIGGLAGTGLWVARYPAPNGIPLGGCTAHYVFPPGAGSYSVSVGDDNCVYVLGPGTTNHTPLMKLDLDLNLITQYLTSDSPNSLSGAPSFKVHNGQIIFGTPQEASPHQFSLEVYTIASPMVKVGSLDLANNTTGYYPAISISDCYALSTDGIFLVCPPPGNITLGQIVADLSDRAGLDSTQYNVDDLTDLVDGYTIDNQMTCQVAIEPLMSVYGFDTVERAGVQTFVKRGKNPVAELLDSEFGATDGDPVPLTTTTRAQDEDLPATLNITYPNPDAAYQPNTQYARIVSTNSQSQLTLQVAVVLDDNTAKAVAETLLNNARIEREEIDFALTRKWAYLEPTDSINARRYTLRITDATAGANQVMSFKSRPTNHGIWLPSKPTGSPASGWNQPGIATPQTTNLVMLDIPLISDTDQPGFYAAMAGKLSSKWAGCVLYQSKDAGVTWTQIATTSAASVIGTASSALGAFDGGNIFDEGNYVDVVVGAGGGELQSYTRASILNGSGLYLVGNEVIQARSATLVAASTYRLTGLLRGRRGSDYYIPHHLVGETVIALPVLNIPASTADLNKAWQYKAVTVGQSLSSTPAVTFTWTGVSLRPYSPCHVGGGPNSAGDITINWTRRTRIGGTWVDFNDVLLGESTEAYDVLIYDSSFGSVARVISTTAPTCTYLAADQTTDLGGVQEHVYGAVYQKGGYGPGWPTSFVINGNGGSDGTVSVPVTPPGSPPPSSGCTLPTSSSSLNWATPGVSIISPALDPSMDWVVKLTTGAAVAGIGTVTMAEYGGGPIQRTGVLSTEPCGNPLTAFSTITSATLTWPYYMLGNPNPAAYPTLAAFTDYYFTVNSSAPGVMFAQLQLPH